MSPTIFHNLFGSKASKNDGNQTVCSLEVAPETAIPRSSSTTTPLRPPSYSPPTTPPRRPSHPDNLPLAMQDAIVIQRWNVHHSLPAPKPSPSSFHPSTLLVTGICDEPQQAETVFKALLKSGTLSATDHTPDTNRIAGVDLPRQMKFLSIPAVRLLIKVLFFWEEEVVRLRRYEGEEGELRTALERFKGRRAQLGPACSDEDAEDEEGKVARAEERRELDTMVKELEFRLLAVYRRRQIVPSEREAERDQLPRYDVHGIDGLLRRS